MDVKIGQRWRFNKDESCDHGNYYFVGEIARIISPHFVTFRVLQVENNNGMATLGEYKNICIGCRCCQYLDGQDKC